jgi:hypothetical protein
VCAYLQLEWRRRLRQTRWRESDREFRYRIKGGVLSESGRPSVIASAATFEQARHRRWAGAIGAFHFVTNPTLTIPYREVMLLR